MERIVALFGRTYERRTSPVPLAVFRIAFSLVCLLEIAQLFAFRRFVFDAVPGSAPAPWFVAPLLLVWMAALGCLTVGWRTRAAAAANYALAVAVLGVWAMRAGHDWHIDSGFLTGSLLLLVAPAGASLSVDRLIARGRAAAERRTLSAPEVSLVHTVFLALAVGLMYWDSVLWKLTSPIYLSGLGFWTPASLPFNTFLDVTPFLGPEWLVRGAGYFVLLFEATFLLLLLVPRARGPAVAAGLAFHLGILAAFPIPLFSLQMVAFYLGLVSPSAFARVARTIRRRAIRTTVYFDEACPLCRRTAATLEALDVARGVRWAPLPVDGAAPAALAHVPPTRLREEMHAVDDDGRVHAGADAYAALLRAMVWTAPLGWIMRVPPARSAARLVYGLVASRRRRDRDCDDVRCAAPASGGSSRAERAAGRPPAWERPAAAGLLAIWVVSFVVIALASPFHRAYIPLAESTHDRLERIGWGYRRLVYPWTGFSAHGVFMDYHFARYTRQLALVQRRPDGDRELPTTRADGTSGRYAWGRQWVHWVFRTASPAVPRERREAALRRWVAFWLSESGGGAGEIVIRERDLDVSLDEWREGLGRRNRARPWRDVGRIVEEGGRLRVDWYARPTAALAAP